MCIFSPPSRLRHFSEINDNDLIVLGKFPTFLCDTRGYSAWQRKDFFYVCNFLIVNVIPIASLNFQRFFH